MSTPPSVITFAPSTYVQEANNIALPPPPPASLPNGTPVARISTSPISHGSVTNAITSATMSCSASSSRASLTDRVDVLHGFPQGIPSSSSTTNSEQNSVRTDAARSGSNGVVFSSPQPDIDDVLVGMFIGGSLGDIFISGEQTAEGRRQQEANNVALPPPPPASLPNGTPVARISTSPILHGSVTNAITSAMMSCSASSSRASLTDRVDVLHGFPQGIPSSSSTTNSEQNSVRTDAARSGSNGVVFSSPQPDIDDVLVDMYIGGSLDDTFISGEQTAEERRQKAAMVVASLRRRLKDPSKARILLASPLTSRCVRSLLRRGYLEWPAQI